MAEMLQNEVRESVLTEKDIKKAYTRWYNCCEISNSYERMQTVSFCYAISSVLKKLYPKEEEYVAALQRHLNFFNCQGIWGSSLLGVAMALEEEKAIGKDISDETIINVKTGLRDLWPASEIRLTGEPGSRYSSLLQLPSVCREELQDFLSASCLR